MSKPRLAVLHYTAPPVIGGVEAVISAHVQVIQEFNYPVTVIAGRGEASALPEGVEFIRYSELDTQSAALEKLNSKLSAGVLPEEFNTLVDQITGGLAPILDLFDTLIVHNLFTKHFNLPATVSLNRLLDRKVIKRCIAWCHDFTWTSPRSGHKVHPGYPWDLLREKRPEVTYVVVSEERCRELAELYNCPEDEIQVVYNGVDPGRILGLSKTGQDLVARLGVLDADIALLMPVRVTKAKNIELALKVVAALKEKGIRPKLVLTGPPDPHESRSIEYFHTLKDLRDELDIVEEMRFVFECGPDPEKPYTIGLEVVGDLFRVCDVMFMPSHTEGFGMPVVEAGLAGLLVVSTPVPAAVEIGREDVRIFDAETDPGQLAEELIAWIDSNPLLCFRRRVRQNYTWQEIFRKEIEPMLLRK